MPSESTSLTTSIIVLNGLSLFIAIVILALSIRDCGMLSLCLNPLFAIITIGYHTTILALAYKRPEEPLPIGYTIWAYLMSLAWVGAYIAMAIVLSGRETEFPIFDIRIEIPQHMRSTQKIQTMLDPLESVIIANIAVKSTMSLRKVREDKGKGREEPIEV
ncbi:hypothetical protein B0H34DRAFT_689445 [Crassisporium funariophilum]|nr:hypothetical protein B0H34DRAFT_689445 [Crassisporium funariophilum]